MGRRQSAVNSAVVFNINGSKWFIRAGTNIAGFSEVSPKCTFAHIGAAIIIRGQIIQDWEAIYCAGSQVVNRVVMQCKSAFQSVGFEN